jgi:hypothetical protein
MYKKLIASSLVAASVIFSGCGSSDTTCRFGVQNAIDKGNYDKAISDLKGQCSTAFTKSDLNMNLAAAYMGKSGYSVSDIADTLINSNKNGSNAFTSFLDNVNGKKQPESLPNLYTAGDYFIAAIESNTTVPVSTLCSASVIRSLDNSRRTNACLYIGFNETIKTANTITYLTGNVNSLVNSINSQQNNTPYDMKASLDALAWSMSSNYVSKGANITAVDVNISGTRFAHVKVDYGTNGLFYRLAKSMTQDANNSTVVTDGYCDANGSKVNCTGIENADGSIDTANSNAANCYACPVVFDSNNTTLGVGELLVNSLNSGSETIAAVANDPDITNSIGDFKYEITGRRDGNVTIQEIINYLQK